MNLIIFDIINISIISCSSLLCMLPEEAKSSYQMADSGYDTYLRDAHRQVNRMNVFEMSFNILKYHYDTSRISFIMLFITVKNIVWSTH